MRRIKTKTYIKILSFLLILFVLIVWRENYRRNMWPNIPGISNDVIERETRARMFCDCLVSQDFDDVRTFGGKKLSCSGLFNCSCGRYYAFCVDSHNIPYTGVAEYLNSGKVKRKVYYKNGIEQRIEK